MNKEKKTLIRKLILTCLAILLFVIICFALVTNYKYYSGEFEKPLIGNHEVEDIKSYTHVGTLQINEKYKTIFVYRKDGKTFFMNSDGVFDSSEIYIIKK